MKTFLHHAFIVCVITTSLIMTQSGFAASSENAIMPEGFLVTPSQNDEVKSIASIVIKASYFDELYPYEGKTIQINGDSYAFTSRTTGDYQHILTLTLDTPVTEPGRYNIVIPKGTFHYLDSYDDYKKLDNEEFSYWVTVTDETVDPDPGTEPDPDDPDPDDPDTDNAIIPTGFSVEPAPGSEVDALDSFQITGANLYDGFEADANIDILINGIKSSCSTSVWGAGGKNNVLIFTLATPIIKDGSYIIEIPEGTFTHNRPTNGNTGNDKFLFTIKVVGEGENPDGSVIPDGFTVNPSPGSKVKSLSAITISSTKGYEALELYDEYETYILINGEEVYVEGEDPDGDGKTLVLKLDEPITESGTYTIVIPAETFTYEDGESYYWVDNTEFSFTLIVDATTGVNNILKTKNVTTEIYTIDGCRVKEMIPGKIYIIREGSSVKKIFVK